MPINDSLAFDGRLYRPQVTQDPLIPPIISAGLFHSRLR